MRRWDENRRGQNTAANVILENPTRYGAGLVTWATLHLRRHGGGQQQAVVASSSTVQQPEQLTLFENPNS